MGWPFVSDLIDNLERQSPSVYVRIFVASDSPEFIENASSIWGARILRDKAKVATHSALWEHEPDLADDLISDWYLLAMSDVLVVGSQGSFSYTAAWLGMHSACRFIVKDELVAEPCVNSL